MWRVSKLIYTLKFALKCTEKETQPCISITDFSIYFETYFQITSQQYLHEFYSSTDYVVK